MSGWTPGEWVVAGDGVSVYAPDGGWHIAGPTCPRTPPESVRQANARLIAAAPSLARACASLLECEGEAAEKRCTYCGEKCASNANSVCPVKLARAALAQAKGGE